MGNRKRSTECPCLFAASSVNYSGVGLFSLTFLSNVFFMSVMLCLSNHPLMSSFLSLNVGGLSFCLITGWFFKSC